VEKTGPGSYDVVFGKSAKNCALNATLGKAKGEPVPGLIAVSGDETNDRAVLVRTYNVTGQLRDRGFHLALECQPKKPFEQFSPAD
jgi:hypothetical protein